MSYNQRYVPVRTEAEEQETAEQAYEQAQRCLPQLVAAAAEQGRSDSRILNRMVSLCASRQGFLETYRKKQSDLNEVFVMIIQDPDTKADLRDELMTKVMNNNAGILAQIVRPFLQQDDGKITVDDINQEARIGMFKAIRAYKPLTDYKFSSFSVKVMRNHLISLFQMKINRTRTDEISMETITARSGKGRQDARLIDSLAANGETPEETAAKDARTQLLKQSLRTLPPDQRFVAYCRYGLIPDVGAQTQRQVAGFMGVSQAAVSKIERGMIAGMKEAIQMQLQPGEQW